MKKIAGIFAVLLILAACANQQQGAPANDVQNDRNNVSHVADHPPQNGQRLDNPNIIPSETSDKTRTTNRDGETYSGVGKDIYSTIGTSGIHAGGISSYFQSILEGEGIDGVSVFVVDDAVILARDKAATSSHKYDNTQKQLLSGNKGQSGKGESNGVADGNGNDLDNLQQAKHKMQEMFNGNVTVLTITQPGATDLISGIKKDVENHQYQRASNDLLKLLNMTNQQ